MCKERINRWYAKGIHFIRVAEGIVRYYNFFNGGRFTFDYRRLIFEINQASEMSRRIMRFVLETCETGL